MSIYSVSVNDVVWLGFTLLVHILVILYSHCLHRLLGTNLYVVSSVMHVSVYMNYYLFLFYRIKGFERLKEDDRAMLIEKLGKGAKV